VPNEHELLQLAGAPPGERSPAELASLARALTIGTVVVTLGGRGALLVPPDGPALLQPPPPVRPVDTTGAGDAFCGALAVALAAGTAPAEAVATAVTAAALSTTGPGARGALPDAAAVDAARRALPPAVPVDGAVDPAAGRAQARPADDRGGTSVSEPDQPVHTTEAAEGGDPPGEESGGRTPHPEQPAEGRDAGGEGADTP
jgi:ribokinase